MMARPGLGLASPTMPRDTPMTSLYFTSTPTQYQMGTALSTSAKYRRARAAGHTSIQSAPRPGACDCLTRSNMPLSTTPTRRKSSANPSMPPIRNALRQSATNSVTKYAQTAPMIPTVATMVVAKPRCSLLTNSLTSVIPAPSSPARPKPAIKRSVAYWL